MPVKTSIKLIPRFARTSAGGVCPSCCPNANAGARSTQAVITMYEIFWIDRIEEIHRRQRPQLEGQDAPLKASRLRPTESSHAKQPGSLHPHRGQRLQHRI